MTGRDLVREAMRSARRAKNEKQVRCHDCNGRVSGPHDLSYGEFFEDADRRAAAGRVQIHCPTCNRWRWPDERAGSPVSQEAER